MRLLGRGQSPWGAGTRSYQRWEHRLLQTPGFCKPANTVQFLEISQGGGTWKRKGQFPRSKSWVAVNGLPADGRQVKGGERAGHTKMRARGTYHVESPASASGVLGGM